MHLIAIQVKDKISLFTKVTNKDGCLVSSSISDFPLPYPSRAWKQAEEDNILSISQAHAQTVIVKTVQKDFLLHYYVSGISMHMKLTIIQYINFYSCMMKFKAVKLVG